MSTLLKPVMVSFVKKQIKTKNNLPTVLQLPCLYPWLYMQESSQSAALLRMQGSAAAKLQSPEKIS